MKWFWISVLIVIPSCGNETNWNESESGFLSWHSSEQRKWLSFWVPGQWNIILKPEAPFRHKDHLVRFLYHHYPQIDFPFKKIEFFLPEDSEKRHGATVFIDYAPHPSPQLPTSPFLWIDPSASIKPLTHTLEWLFQQQWTDLHKIKDALIIEPNLLFPLPVNGHFFDFPNINNLPGLSPNTNKNTPNPNGQQNPEESGSNEEDFLEEFGGIFSGGMNTIDLSVHHRNIRLPEALEFGKERFKGSRINVAILDTGVDYMHPQIKEAMWTDPNPLRPYEKHGIAAFFPREQEFEDPIWQFGGGETPGPGKPCQKGELTYKGRPIRNECGHGTHVAGLIAARPQSGSNMRGVCPFCFIISVNVSATILSDQGAVIPIGIDDRAQIRGFNYILSRRDPDNPNLLVTHLINASIGRPVPSRAIFYYLKILNSYNIGIVAAAGNSKSNLTFYPAAYGTTLSVAAVGQNARQPFRATSFSNYGDWVDISAPGLSLYSLQPGGGYAYLSGTSQASPIVAGALALLLGFEDGIPMQEAYKRMKRTAHFKKLYDHNPEFFINNGQNHIYLMGSGILDVMAMLEDTPQSIYENPQDELITSGCAVSQVGKGKRYHSFHLFILVFILCVLSRGASLWSNRKTCRMNLNMIRWVDQHTKGG